MENSKESLTCAIRLTVYSYIDTHRLLTVITNLSRSERRCLDHSKIAGNRHLKVNPPIDLSDFSCWIKRMPRLSLLWSLTSTLTVELGRLKLEKWTAKHSRSDKLAWFIMALPEKFQD